MHGTQPAPAPREPVRRFLYVGERLKIGTFELPLTCPCFRDTGPIQRHVVVFPRYANWIEPEDTSPAVADRRTILCFNLGDRYTRGPISERGDFADGYAPSPSLLEDLARFGGLTGSDPEQRPFSEHFRTSDPETYLLHIRILHHVTRQDPVDPLLVEESACRLLERIFVAPGAPPPLEGSGARPREIAEAARHHIARHFRENLSLDELADDVGISTFYLCRLFRESTGTTIHQYRDELRLRHALTLVLESDTDLTTLALDLGYSSHSHFTERFRRLFGVPPSEIRRLPVSQQVEQALQAPLPSC